MKNGNLQKIYVLNAIKTIRSVLSCFNLVSRVSRLPLPLCPCSKRQLALPRGQCTGKWARKTPRGGGGGHPPKWVPFQALGIWKGRVICYFRLKNCLNALQKNAIDVKKLRTFSGFLIYSYLKTVHLQQLKGVQSRKLGMWKGCYLSMKGIRKEYRFWKKWW